MITDFQYQAMLARLAPKHGPANVEAVEDESLLHQDILDYCKSKGWIALHGSMAHKAKRTAGEQDFTIMADGGRVFFVEAKSKQGKLTPEQLGLRLWAEKLGHKIHEVRNLAAFIEIVKPSETGIPASLEEGEAAYRRAFFTPTPAAPAPPGNPA